MKICCCKEKNAKRLLPVFTSCAHILLYGFAIIAATFSGVANADGQAPVIVPGTLEINTTSTTAIAIAYNATDNGGFAAAGACHIAVRNANNGQWLNFDTEQFTPAWYQHTFDQNNGTPSAITCAKEIPFALNGSFVFYYRVVDQFFYYAPWVSVAFTDGEPPDTQPPQSCVTVVNADEFEWIFIGETTDRGQILSLGPFNVQAAIRETGTNNWYDFNTGRMTMGTWAYDAFEFGNEAGTTTARWAVFISNLDSDFEFEFYFRSIDDAGNLEAWQSVAFIDQASNCQR